MIDSPSWHDLTPSQIWDILEPWEREPSMWEIVLWNVD